MVATIISIAGSVEAKSPAIPIWECFVRKDNALTVSAWWKLVSRIAVRHSATTAEPMSADVTMSQRSIAAIVVVPKPVVEEVFPTNAAVHRNPAENSGDAASATMVAAKRSTAGHAAARSPVIRTLPFTVTKAYASMVGVLWKAASRIPARRLATIVDPMTADVTTSQLSIADHAATQRNVKTASVSIYPTNVNRPITVG